MLSSLLLTFLYISLALLVSTRIPTLFENWKNAKNNDMFVKKTVPKIESRKLYGYNSTRKFRYNH